MPGLFITLEGMEGAGKSTIAERLEIWLRQKGHQTVCTREPGGTEIGEQLRQLILNAQHPLSIPAELLLFEAARSQIMTEIVLPHLASGKTVILDRHCDSTVAYQGYGRGINIELIQQINDLVCAERIPDLTLLLDIDVETGLSRARNIQEHSHFQDRFETETLDFLQRVREGFLQIAKQNPQRVVRITTHTGIESVWDDVQNALSRRLFSGSSSL